MCALVIGLSGVYAEQNMLTGKIEWAITGRSRPDSVRSYFDIEENPLFASREDANLWVQELEQKLDNSRMFKSVQAETKYPDDDSVIITVTIEDGTFFFPVPYAFYNSNEGFQSGAVLNFLNIAGTLQNLTFVGLYAAPPDQNDMLQWANPNFFLLGTWSGFQAGPNKLGLVGSVMRMRRSVVDSGYLKGEFKETGLMGGLNVNTPLPVQNLSNTASVRLSVSPESSLEGEFDNDYLAYGPQLTSQRVQNSIEYNSIIWKQNLREGIKLGLGGEWSREETRYAGIHYGFKTEAEGAFYAVLNDRFNPSARILAFANTGKPILASGAWTRGVRNNELAANAAVFVNTGFQISLFRLGGTEFHVNPFVDAAYVHEYGNTFNENRVAAGAGAEFILMIDAAKNLPVKLGIAWDLRPEEEIGGGKRLEVEFAFNLTY